ncbi:hypothetical protein ACOTTU_01825 [Roseobacter sp. EG26]|uniref:hypothetical protein n=1 Tax=Roseobacter sp. EG26 TaxID=3412477 RepID=UPI003CE5220C
MSSQEFQPAENYGHLTKTGQGNEIRRAFPPPWGVCGKAVASILLPDVTVPFLSSHRLNVIRPRVASSLTRQTNAKGGFLLPEAAFSFLRDPETVFKIGWRIKILCFNSMHFDQFYGPSTLRWRILG